MGALLCVVGAAKRRNARRQDVLVARTKTIKGLLSEATPVKTMRKAEIADVANERCVCALATICAIPVTTSSPIDSSSFHMTRQLLTARQLCLVSDVRLVYPIVEVERRRVYTIRGVPLPTTDLFCT